MFMDALADKTFDESNDGIGFTILTDEPLEKRNKIYELTKSEQALVLAYRLMTAEQKTNLYKTVRSEQT